MLKNVNWIWKTSVTNEAVFSSETLQNQTLQSICTVYVASGIYFSNFHCNWNPRKEFTYHVLRDIAFVLCLQML